tara:strand:+ start:5018 stop:5242 length:225 start_codon:yes stop_codon:yes gene_type:complete
MSGDPNYDKAVAEYEKFLKFQEQQRQKAQYTDLRMVKPRPIHYYDINEITTRQEVEQLPKVNKAKRKKRRKKKK